VSEEGPAGLPADGRPVLEALEELPGGPQLLELAQVRDDVAVVGGAARDLLLGHAPRELDVVLDGGAADFARQLSSLIDRASARRTARPAVTVHDRFGTAALDWEAGRIDIAERRAESYAAPGALPDVRAGTVEEDLRRRDFSVNAIAAPLGGPLKGTLQAAPHALEDLAAGRLRVLHDESFLDDPTRLLRLGRYNARLGFVAEERTAELAAESVAGGALSTVSRARVGAELRLALAEADPVKALSALSELGLLAALEPWLRFEEELARRALAILPHDGRLDLLLLAQLLLAPVRAGDTEPGEEAMFELLDALEFTAADRERAIRTALAAPRIVTDLRAAGPASQLHDALVSRTPEAIALAAALGSDDPSDATAEAAHRWLQTLRHVRLSITGDDLLAAGLPAGPEIGRRLAAALQRKLDGELDDGHEAELRAALEAHV
jgi:tRNA nucleotidyltransferase (CCA-adding enzyme)